MLEIFQPNFEKTLYIFGNLLLWRRKSDMLNNSELQKELPDIFKRVAVICIFIPYCATIWVFEGILLTFMS